MAICDRGGLPVAVNVASASPYRAAPRPRHSRCAVPPRPPVVPDRRPRVRLRRSRQPAHDAGTGIEMIAANRQGRAKTQDGRPLRRAKRRWKIERLFAWLHNCRRVVTRWEHYVGNYLGMVQLACARILLRASIRQPAASRWINNRRLLGSLHSSNGTSGAPE